MPDPTQTIRFKAVDEEFRLARDQNETLRAALRAEPEWSSDVDETKATAPAETKLPWTKEQRCSLAAFAELLGDFARSDDRQGNAAAAQSERDGRLLIIQALDEIDRVHDQLRSMREHGC